MSIKQIIGVLLLMSPVLITIVICGFINFIATLVGAGIGFAFIGIMCLGTYLLIG